MALYPYDLVESYALEIIARAKAIHGKCTILLSKDFASDSPEILARTLRKIAKYLESAVIAIFDKIKWDIMSDNEIKTYFDQLRHTDKLIQWLSSHIRYIDGAQTRKLPWSIITSIESYLTKISPDKNIKIMLRPQWTYNFSIITTNLADKYQEELSEYKDILPGELYDDVFSEFQDPFHIISFPSLERKNILIYCLLGHEIGHLVARNHIEESKFLKNIKNDIAKIIDERVNKNPDLDKPIIKEILIVEEMENAKVAWKIALEELLSDIVGALIFGPAALLSTFEFSMQFAMDHKPGRDNNFYPPWRSRIRKVQEIIEYPEAFLPLNNDYFSPETVKKVNKRFETIKQYTQNDNDQQIIDNDAILSIVYKEVERAFEEIKKVIINELSNKGLVISRNSLYENLADLIKRLDADIPPNAYEYSISNRKYAELVDIINASWFYKISWEDDIFNKDDGTFNDDILRKRDKMNRLTLKAIEFAEIEQKYKEHIT